MRSRADVALRILFLALLAVVLAFPRLLLRREQAHAVANWPERDTAGVRALLVDAAPGLVVRASDHPPQPSELDLIAATAVRSPLLVALPPQPPSLVAWPPDRVRAGVAAAIHFRARGGPGQELLIGLSDAAGSLDSVRVTTDAKGTASGGFRVVPQRAGWHAWSVSLDEVRAGAGAWAADTERRRVLVASGPPDWEARFVVRALEEAGVNVTVAQPLGRGLTPGGGLSSLPTSAPALAPYDAVVVLAGAATTRAQVAALRDYVLNSGGGVLATDAATAQGLGVASFDATPRNVVRGQLRWHVPLELAPLPEIGEAVAARTLQPITRLGLPAASLPDATPSAGPLDTAAGNALLILTPLGRGRAAALGISSTWQWRMQAGRIEEHRDFWRSLVDWLSGGLRDSITIALEPRAGTPGTRVGVTLGDSGAQDQQSPFRAATVTLVRPDGSQEPLHTRATGGAGTRRASFLATDGGVYAVRVEGSRRPVAFFADRASSPASSAWARLTLLANGSGGRAVRAPEIDVAVEEWRRARAATRSRVDPGLLLLGLIVGTAIAEWTLRRATGRA